MAMTIANWYGEYSQAGFQGIGSSNANRFRVSGEPVMVYTGASHPVWRMLLTSYNNDNSVSKIIEMNAATGAMRIYTPQLPMSIEAPVIQAFGNASGVGATLVKADGCSGVSWQRTRRGRGSGRSPRILRCRFRRLRALAQVCWRGRSRRTVLSG